MIDTILGIVITGFLCTWFAIILAHKELGKVVFSKKYAVIYEWDCEQYSIIIEMESGDFDRMWKVMGKIRQADKRHDEGEIKIISITKI